MDLGTWLQEMFEVHDRKQSWMESMKFCETARTQKVKVYRIPEVSATPSVNKKKTTPVQSQAKLITHSLVASNVLGLIWNQVEVSLNLL